MISPKCQKMQLMEGTKKATGSQKNINTLVSCPNIQHEGLEQENFVLSNTPLKSQNLHYFMNAAYL